MDNRLNELAMWLGLTVSALIMQLGGDRDHAIEVANDAIGSMNDHYEMREKIEKAQRDNEHEIYIEGYKITF